MSATQGRSEATLDRQRREAEINEALKQEAARHAAALKNMHRLRALRLAQEDLAREDSAREDKVNHKADPSQKPNKKAKYAAAISARSDFSGCRRQPKSNLRQL
jgi:hypothetical protein